MRILLLNQYFPPDSSATAAMAADVARALCEAGHTVRVIAGRPSYGSAEHLPWRWRRLESYQGTVVERVGSSAFDRRRMPGRVANYVSFLLLAAWTGLLRRADVVLAMTDPPLVSLVGTLVARWWNAPLVYNIRDLHPDMALASGMIRPGLAARCWEWLHRFSLHRAARVIVLGDDMQRRIVAKGVPPGRVVVVRDGAPLEGPDAARDGPGFDAVRAGGGFVVMHAGNLGFGGGWEALLDAARELSGEGIRFVFVGHGAARAALQRRAAGVAAVTWLDRRPAGEVPQLLAAGDLQVVTVRRGLEGLILPSKLYPVLAAGRPVLAVAPEGSDVARLVREHRCGWVADPEDAAAVAAAVRAAKADPAELAERARRAREAAPRFDRRILLAQYVKEIESVQGRRA